MIGHMGATRNAMLYGSRCYQDEIRRILQADQQAAGNPLLSPLLDELGKEVKRLVPPSNEDSFPGSMPNVIPARVANYFDLKGPNMTVDTGFSSALAAIEVASRHLRANEIEMALVGGINGNTTPEMQHIVSELSRSKLTLAEGAFLLALVTKAKAREAGLPVLGYLDGFSTALPPEPMAALTCGAGNSDRFNYLGAEGALAVLQALHHPHSETSILCHDDEMGAGTTIRLYVEGAAERAAVAPDAPSKPFEVQRTLPC